MSHLILIGVFSHHLLSSGFLTLGGKKKTRFFCRIPCSVDLITMSLERQQNHLLCLRQFGFITNSKLNPSWKDAISCMAIRTTYLTFHPSIWSKWYSMNALLIYKCVIMSFENVPSNIMFVQLNISNWNCAKTMKLKPAFLLVFPQSPWPEII